jgi:cytochrome c2
MFKFILSFLIVSNLYSQDISFKLHGREIKKIPISQLIEENKNLEINFFEPHEGVIKTYKTIDLNLLLQKIYGPTWNKSEEVLFTCVDGYQPSVAMEKFNDFHSYLAYEEKDKKEFQVINKKQKNEVIDLAPLYLVWDNSQIKNIKHWPNPYQVVGIDLISFNDRYPKIAPPTKDPKVLRGFTHFRQYCLTCHSINGQGGEKSVELNYPVNVTQYYREEFLTQWINNPTSIRHNALMPEIVFEEDKSRSEVIKEIIAYLKAMKSKKIRPTQ